MKNNLPKIKIIGVGGAGGNAITRMARSKISGVDLIAINTDVQDLRKITADFKLRIGKNITKGLGAGMNPEIGRMAAQEQKGEIEEILKGSDMVFITAAFGGGTGSGASPVVAEIAKGLGVLTVAVITRPFSFEGSSRKSIAQEGIKTLEGKVDSLILVSNDKLISLVKKDTSLTKAFSFADDILKETVGAVVDLILKPSLVSISFADIRAIFKNAGRAFFGQGEGTLENRAQEAVARALNSPLLEISPNLASRILFNISARKLKLAEVDAVTGVIAKSILPQTQVIFGAREDQGLEPGRMRVTLIATGFSSH